MIGSPETDCSFDQTSGVKVDLLGDRPLASAKAPSALVTLSPILPSISPGEKCARSSRTWSLTASGVMRSVAGCLPVKLAALMLSGFRSAAVPGSDIAGSDHKASPKTTIHRV